MTSGQHADYCDGIHHSGEYLCEDEQKFRLKTGLHGKGLCEKTKKINKKPEGMSRQEWRKNKEKLATNPAQPSDL